MIVRHSFQSVLTAVVMILAPVFFAAAQQSKATLPMVVGAAVPFYPIGPHTVNIQGTVRVKIATDGHHVTTATVEDDGGNPALGRAAKENAMTWQFSTHSPTSFIVTYRYILVAALEDIESNAPNSKVVLRFPTTVEVYAQRWPGTVDMAPDVKK